jgi:hypothetical protein
MDMPDITDLFESLVNQLPKLHWTGTNTEGEDIPVASAKAGQDWSRGPWVKFAYMEGGEAHTIQGYFLYVGGERIKFDGTKEADDDDMRMMVEGGGLMVKFTGKLQDSSFNYRFVGRP